MRARSVGRHLWWVGLALVGCVFSTTDAAAQSPGSGPLALNDAIQLALKNYPTIKESRARAQAAEEGVGGARTAFLPRLDIMWHENMGGTNNLFVLLLPAWVVPAISAPLLL